MFEIIIISQGLEPTAY